MSPEVIALEIQGPSAVLPRGLTSFGAASDGAALFVLGGYFGRPHEYSEAGQSGELLRMDLASGAWTHEADTAKAQSVALVAHGNSLIRSGGMQARNPEGEPADLHSLDAVEAFDTEARVWASLPALPSPRSSHDAIVIGDSMWVAGGWNLDGEDRRWHQTVARLDLTAPDRGWTEVDAPFQRRALAAATAGGKLIVIGGIDAQRQLSTAVDVLEPTTGEWSRGPDYPGPGFGLAAASAGDQVFASGMDGVVFRWRPGEAEWTRVGTLAYPRFFHRMVPTEANELVVVGGIREMASGTRVRPIERISTVVQPGPTMLAYTLPSPLPTKNRQGVAVDGDSLYLFGGNVSLGQHDFEPKHFSDAGQVLDLAALTWRSIAPYPAKRQTMSTFVTGWGHVVSVAGFGHDGEVARTHPEVFAYHPGKDQWREVGKLPGQGRTQFGLAVHDDAILLMGGLDYDPRRPKKEQFRHELEVLRAPLSPAGMDFETTSLELREPRRAFASATLDGKVYLIGGMREGFALVDTCEAHDLAAGTWSTIACPSRSRLSAQMVALGGKLYLAAGSSRSSEEGKLSSDPSLEVYDPATNRWTTVVDALPIEPKHLAMRAYGDRLLLVSTHNDEGEIHLVLLDPATR